MIARIVEDFSALESSDPALIAGTGRIAGTDVLVIAQENPKSRDARAAVSGNYGMMRADGYWFVIRELERAAAIGLPVVTLIDTPGADPSKQGVERLLAWSISACISSFLTFPNPLVSVVIGEGGSGGALALQVADRRLMASDALYSVISPESCSAILFRDGDHVKNALELLRPGAEDMLRAGVVDEIIDWSNDLAIEDHARACANLQERIGDALRSLGEEPAPERLKRRSRTILSLGRRKSARATGTEPADVSAPPASTRFAVTAGPPEMKRFVRIGASEGTIGLLQHAYFSGRPGRTAPPGNNESEILCPKKDGGCGAVSAIDEYNLAGWACPVCGRGERLSASHWIQLVCDPDSFRELNESLELSDLDDGGYETDAYRALRAKAREESGGYEALRIGTARIDGIPCALAVSEFKYLGGTLGAVCGEKIRILCEIARDRRLPVVAVTSSGGARMQEGTLALAQMAKANAALLRLEEDDLPYVSVLADPCTGGALGSYATQARVILAEPQAMIAFAGPRVLKLAGLPSDERLLVSNNAYKFGGIDEIVPRTMLRARLSHYLKIGTGGESAKAPATASDSRTLARPPVGAKDVRRWMAGFVSRVTGLFTVDGYAGEEIESKGNAVSVTALADFALVTVPILLKHAAESSDARVRANAIEALARFPSNTVEELRRALDDNHHRVRTAAAVALLERDPEDANAAEALRRLLRSEDAVERCAGLYGLARCTLPTLKDEALRVARDVEVEVRVAAAIALFAFGDSERASSLLDEVAQEMGTPALERARALVRILAPDAAARATAYLAARGL